MKSFNLGQMERGSGIMEDGWRVKPEVRRPVILIIQVREGKVLPPGRDSKNGEERQEGKSKKCVQAVCGGGLCLPSPLLKPQTQHIIRHEPGPE